MPSFHNGFATKQQESFYNKLIFKLCQLMQDTLIEKFNYQFTLTDIPFMKKVVKIKRTMQKLETYRYNMPREAIISNSFEEIANLFSEYFKQEQLDISKHSGSSDMGTNFSLSFRNEN